MDGINTADGVEEFNQGGPSMFDYRKNHGPSIKSKYNNVNYGASGPHDKIAPSLDEDNTEKNSFGDMSIGNFSAPITIKGVTFDAGDVMRLGIMGYKAGKKGVEDYRHEHRGERALRKHDKALKKSDTKKYKEMKSSIKNQKQINKLSSNVPQMSLEDKRKGIKKYNDYKDFFSGDLSTAKKNKKQIKNITSNMFTGNTKSLNKKN